MLYDDGTLAKMGRTEELLNVVGQYGDKAMDFIWRHKKSLCVGAVLIAFLNAPEPFIKGLRDITQIGLQPVTEGEKTGIKTAASHTNWTLVFLGIVAIEGCLIAFRKGLRSKQPKRAENFSS